MVHSAVCAFAVTVISGACVWRGNTALETWQFDAARATVRVQKFDEEPVMILPQYVFVLQASDTRPDHWREIMSWRVNDPIPIQRKQVKRLDRNVVYAFGNWLYAVTTDGGVSWSRWDGKRHFRKSTFVLIKSVTMRSNGEGTMRVSYKPDPNTFAEQWLATDDFGQHWTTDRNR